jgi:transmembrane sensor
MSDNEIEIQASEWLARLDRLDRSPEVVVEFNRWKGADARHAAAYARLAAAWQALDRVQALQPATNVTARNDYLVGGRRSMPNRRVAVGFAAAASVTIAAVVLWILRASPSTEVYATTKGGFQVVVLKDRSVVELNTDTRLRVELGPTMRKIQLIQGEANFEVAHDAARPFVVSTGQTAVLAVGTRFNVRKLDDAVEVTVEEGRVMVGAPDVLELAKGMSPLASPLLVAGQTAVADTGGLTVKTLPENAISRKLGWQNRMLAFDGDRLSDVVAQFNRYNDRQLVIVEPGVAELKIGGFFKPTNLDAFVSVLESDFGVRVKMDGSHRLLLSSAE